VSTIDRRRVVVLIASVALLAGSTEVAATDGAAMDGAAMDSAGSVRLSVGDQAGMERESVTGSVFVPLVLSEPLSHPLVVAYATSDGSAIAGTDYVQWGTPARPRTLTIPAGSVQAQVNVPVLPDGSPEDRETFTVQALTVSDPAVVISDASGVATIVDPRVACSRATARR
jgi:chitinase